MRALTIALTLLASAFAAQAPSSVAAPGRAVDQAVSCGSIENEAQALLTAPTGTRRVSAHVLVVKYRSGSRQFIDPPPYRQELGGRAWRYCGYIPALKAHLVGEEDDDLFTGKLLLNDSGRLLDAGDRVYPSPDGKLFLAGRHSNGEELERWTVSDLTGKVLWAGQSGITKGSALLLEYEAPRWTANGVLRVSAVCNDASHRRGEATLTLSDRPVRWQSQLRCGG